MTILLIAILPFLTGFSFFSAIKNEQGNKLYKKGRVGRAKSAYAGALKSDPDSPEIAFNLGNAYYKEEAFADSESRYQKASKEHKKPLLQSKAFYNLGNSAVRRSQTDKAIEHYKQALRLNPADQDAKYNLELLTKRQDRKQDKQDQKQDKQDQKQNKEEQKKDQSSSAEASEDRQKENQEKENQSGSESSQKDQPQESQSAGQEAGKEERREEEERQQDQSSGQAAQEEEKDQPQEKRSQSQITADQILEALENQEEQVLMSRGSDKGERRAQVKKYVEKDW